jgi:subtilisin family serine protease
VIAPAGNYASDGDHTADFIHLPGDAQGVISISATAPIGWATAPETTFLDNLASYSNFGRSVIDFAAPGGDVQYPGNENCTIAGLTRPCWVFDLVFSTGNNGWYWSAGTSMAAPHAAGVAALIIGANGGEMSRRRTSGASCAAPPTASPGPATQPSTAPGASTPPTASNSPFRTEDRPGRADPVSVDCPVHVGDGPTDAQAASSKRALRGERWLAARLSGSNNSGSRPPAAPER